MRIEISGTEREVQIVQAPKSCFVIMDGFMFPFYPSFVAFCKPIGEEYSQGTILVCPIIDFNDGYATCEVNELCNEFTPSHLKSCVSGWMDNNKGTLRDAVDNITTDLIAHDVFVTPKCCDIIDAIEKGTIKNVDEIC